MSLRLRFISRLLPAVWLGLLVLAFLPQLAVAEQVPAAKAPVTIIIDGTESPEALKKLIDSVSAQDHPVSIGFAAKPPAGAKATGENPSEEVFDLFLRGLRDGWNAIPKAPQYFSSFASWWHSPPGSSGFLLYLLKLLVILGVSGFAGWLVLRLVRSLGPPPPAADPAPLDEKLRPALTCLLKDIAAAAVFIVVASFLAARFFDPLAAEGKLTEQLLHVLPGIAAYIVAGRFLLSPGEPRLRLFMLPRAERHFRLLAFYAVIGMVLLAIFVGLDDQIGAAEDTAAGIIVALTTSILLFKVWWFWDARQDIGAVILSGAPEATGPHILRRLYAVAMPWLLILSAALLWVLGRIAETVPDGKKWAAASGITQLLVVLVPILAVGATILARQRLMTGDPGLTPLQVASRTLLVKLSGAAAWLLGLVLFGWTWRYHLIESQSVEGLAVLRDTVGIIAVAVAGWALTSFLNALFNAYSPYAQSAAAGEDHAIPAATVQTRLGSVLPILRGATVGAAIGLTILLVMSQLGFNIAPLLAGFGILGLAVSFGSQTLVKDIVSGFFFMVEDAFRVGEYIDTGKLKGTVEKISVRSLQLRHQSGLVHTIPFGTLSSVTNASRDWATVKFSLRLDRGTDIEKARKVIKKIGIEMQDDPEYGKSFLMPLKMQGVDEIADSAIIVRAKFTAEPATAGSIQRAALMRIYSAFNQAGIEFASNAVTVRGGGQTEAAAASATASAQPVSVPAPAA
jgi:small-conductance mechanosensitive channel